MPLLKMTLININTAVRSSRYKCILIWLHKCTQHTAPGNKKIRYYASTQLTDEVIPARESNHGINKWQAMMTEFKIPRNPVTGFSKRVRRTASCWILNQEVEISKENNCSHTQTGTELLQHSNDHDRLHYKPASFSTVHFSGSGKALCVCVCVHRK